MEFNNITLEKQEGITKLTIDRPPVNVMNLETIEEISTALEELAKDEETKVLLIRGAGSRAFCAGVEVKDHVGDMVPTMMTAFEKLFRLLRGLGKPSIAVVNGVALGGGCELVAGCDMAIAVEQAQFGQPEVKLGGLAPAAAALFPRIMGQKKAFELILLGENIDAAEAERIGLVNKVVLEEELDATAQGLAGKFLEKSGLSLKLIREAFYQCSDAAGFEAAIKKATEQGIKSWETEDAQEGLKSFLEKRPPVWKNK
ncbi:MAG: enoyl-CoA hydratase/isomerase family protein [Dehalococcoidales bacterium]|jgi:cyclohexa-1,5-dienecarbonyl-CoA hydratase|nr:enoyl-CoA hydratase/isomerase family protein [Dehalococcoidales bacterium]MDP6631919.1 enoyl-CoA hydratase/isomerase family protein [Dehalococcoidales bacterium]MDP7524765.1 enoyl-CoA hydratase/isomerase family protein [Dehalococcoidales bacterium]|tara:strand:- start:1154 stop:1924 length:771 start_codon:yes stop_codon:yes gene_type:complete